MMNVEVTVKPIIMYSVLAAIVAVCAFLIWQSAQIKLDYVSEARVMSGRVTSTLPKAK